MTHSWQEDRLSLRYGLEEIQLDLLETIWRPVVDSIAPWPVWDYVARILYRRNPPVAAAGQLLQSLPQMATGIQRSPYSHVWRDRSGTIDPVPEARVGLTIAGLHALRSRSAEAGFLADHIARYIGYMANWERELVPDPDKPVEMAVRLLNHTQQLLAGFESGLSQLSVQNVHDVLRHEFAPLNLLQSGSGQDLLLTLRLYLAPFHGVQNADQYLDCVERESPQAGRASVNAPEILPHLLDYLSIVLANDQQWSAGALVSAPDLRSAGSLVRTVTSDTEFRDALSGFASVLEQLRTPPVPDDVISLEFGGQKPASLQRLRYWLSIRLDGSDGRDLALNAVDILREVVRLRVEGAHPNAGVRRRAAQARNRLGLPEMIFDWSAAWDHVRARCADAVDVIAREVRRSQTSEHGAFPQQ